MKRRSGRWSSRLDKRDRLPDAGNAGTYDPIEENMPAAKALIFHLQVE